MSDQEKIQDQKDLELGGVDGIEIQDRKNAEDALEIIMGYLKEEIALNFYFVKDHPKAKIMQESVMAKIHRVLYGFIVKGKLPNYHKISEEELERAAWGFWVSRSANRKIVRKPN